MSEQDIDLWGINKLCDILERVKDKKVKPFQLDMVLSLLQTLDHFQSSLIGAENVGTLNKYWVNSKENGMPPTRVRYAIRHFDRTYICKEIFNILREYELCD